MQQENTRQGAVTDEYIRSVISTRRIMSHTLNILSQQERTMRAIISSEQQLREREARERESRERESREREAARRRTSRPITLDDFPTLFSPRPSATTPPRPLVTTSSSTSPRPSTQDIRHATRELAFSDINTPINNICPISREAFTDDEIVMQVVPCGHIFSRDNLRVWFLSSVHCPMCRYDIRNYRNRRTNARERRQSMSSQTNTRNSSSSQSIDRIASFITNDILRQLETNTSDTSNNLLFEYTLLAPETTQDDTSNTSTTDDT